MQTVTDTLEYKYILQLPRDKEVLDYIFDQLTKESKQDWSALLEELFQMHRSSTGFNPQLISKGRFRRLKAAEFRLILAEINTELQALMNSTKYLNFLKKRFGNDQLKNRFQKLITQLELGVTDISLREEFIQIKTDLFLIGEHEMLLQLYKNAYRLIEVQFSEQLDSYLHELMDIQHRVQINTEHMVCGFKTASLLHKAHLGMFDQNDAVNLYDDLCKLLIRHKNVRSKYETLVNILEVSSLLENRSHYMEPYINFTAENFEEILIAVPEKSTEIHVNLAKYLTEEPLPVRLTHLNKAIQSAKDNNNLVELINFKIIHAELACDSGSIDAALELLDEGFFLSLQSEDNEEAVSARVKVLMTKMYILTYLHFAQKDSLALKAMTKTLKQIEKESALRLDHALLVNECKGFLLLAHNDFEEARQLFSRSAKA
ncbi:MAG TPA: hypothetical protein PKM16_10840, partial [Bacteroidia bacterium]|nr:hypothetical protein [Bacteroidia bacterium]